MKPTPHPATPWFDGRHQSTHIKPDARLLNAPPISPGPLFATRFCWESPLYNVYASAWWMNSAPKAPRVAVSTKDGNCTPRTPPRDPWLNRWETSHTKEDKVDYFSLPGSAFTSPGTSDNCTSSGSTIGEEEVVTEEENDNTNPDSEMGIQWAIIEKLVFDTISGLEVDVGLDSGSDADIDTDSGSEENDKIDTPSYPVASQPTKSLETVTAIEPDFGTSDTDYDKARVRVVVRLPCVSKRPLCPFTPTSSMKLDPEVEASSPEQVTTARNVCMWGRRLERIPKVRVPGMPEAVYCFDPARLAPKMERLLRMKYGCLRGKGRVGLPVGEGDASDMVIEEKKEELHRNSKERTRVPTGGKTGGQVQLSSGLASWRGSGIRVGQTTPHTTTATAGIPTKPSFNLSFSLSNFPSLPSTTPSTPQTPFSTTFTSASTSNSSSPSPLTPYSAFSSCSRRNTGSNSTYQQQGANMGTYTPTPTSRGSYSGAIRATIRPALAVSHNQTQIQGLGLRTGTGTVLGLGLGLSAGKQSGISAMPSLSWRRTGVANHHTITSTGA